MRIHIDIRDDIDPETALRRLADVVYKEKLSDYNPKINWLTFFHEDKIYISQRRNRKSNCFVIYKTKRK
jgi:hypothetical protein